MLHKALLQTDENNMNSTWNILREPIGQTDKTRTVFQRLVTVNIEKNLKLKTET
jgi:hypothetical protein